jgi:IS30 family transposase
MIFIIKNNSKHAKKVGENCFNAVSKINQSAQKTFFFNNSFVFIDHFLLKKFLKMDTYFLIKRSPRQKGQLEKTNATLHRFIQKKDLLTNLNDSSLIEIQNQFYNIPRRVLGYKILLELFS